MEKLRISTTLIILVVTIAAWSGVVGRVSVADAASSGQQNVPLHPDVVHGLVRGTTQTGAIDGQLHPDMVHGLVREPAQTDAIAAGQTGGARAYFRPLFTRETASHPDVVHGLVPSLRAGTLPSVEATATGLPRSQSATSFSESSVANKSPFHPDMVHGLIRPSFELDVAGDMRPTGN